LNAQNSRNYIFNTHIEIIKPQLPCAPLRHVLFDFDGTVSLIREGWQQVMVELMVEVLLETPEAEDEAALRQATTTMVAYSTGRPTIDQMTWLVDQVTCRGGQAKTAHEYKRLFLDRLLVRANRRLAALERGQIESAELTVPGVLDLLARLHRQGIVCYLASGTEKEALLGETKALGVDRYFEGRIYGPQDDGPAFSKQMVIQQILGDYHLSGCEFLSFGDGTVEIEYTAEVGGIGVGVASNEVERQGLDEAKRQQLIQAGATLIVPDFREGEALLHYLNGDQ
jgi:phosphoglycolate phosphatase-like HAD superfamily hydrolase